MTAPEETPGTPAPAEALATDEDLSQLMTSRASTYDFLARLYRVEVDDALLAELRAMSYPSGTGSPEMDQGFGLIRGYLSNAWENVRDELAVDYVRSFIGHGNTAYSAAYPYESVYTSPKRLLMQDARDEVLAIYRAAGKDKADDWHEAEDHIALELEFMGLLCKRAAKALDAGDEDGAYALALQQRNFLNDHLLNWTPMMLADLKRFAKTDFYQGLGHLTKGFLASERELLDGIIQEDEDGGEDAGQHD